MKRQDKPQGLPGQFNENGRKLFLGDCPARYTGPIERADGQRPFNGYLWPTESWSACDETAKGVWDSRIRMSIVALADGRWAVEGFLWMIEKDDRRYSWTTKSDQLAKRNCHATRRTAIRTAAADLLRLLRHARRWDNHLLSRDASHWAEAVNWTLLTAYREADGCPPCLSVHRDPPPPRRVMTGLPLFDASLTEAA